MRPSLGKNDRLVFAGLCVLVYLFLTVDRGNLIQAIGALPVYLLALIVVGRFTLWFGESVYFFFRNIAADEPMRRFERTIWQDMSLSLVVGIPVCAWLSGLTPQL